MSTKTKKTKEPGAKAAYERVSAVAESIRNDEPATVAVLSAGDVVRQGDLYLVALGEAPTRSGPYRGRQLAPGTTQGSRHEVVGECELYTPDAGDAATHLERLIPGTRGFEQFIGPVIVAVGPVTVTHPEHGDRSLPAGTYLATYQRSWANQARRQED